MRSHAAAYSLETNDDDVEQSKEVQANTIKPQKLPLIDFEPSFYTRTFKPSFDRLAASLGLLVLAIPMLAVAGLVRQSMGSPVLFRQRRIGLDGRVFEVLKFRSMNADRRHNSEDVDDDARITHKCDNDPRHTTAGRFIRRYSLDELPQLINVARGDMSLVGPRPELESVVERYYTDELHQRHQVKPGLTGLWQISARGDGPMHENGEWDIEYVRTVSLATDLRILIKTPTVIFGDRAGQ